MTLSSMTEPLTIVSLLPELLGTNGDAANARVLAQRARWADIEARIVEVRSPANLPQRVDAVVIGSGTDADLTSARDILQTMVAELRAWSTLGVPILAIGTGWELLSWGIEHSDGSVMEGLGIVAGRAVPRVVRATNDLVVASKFGRLIGFENHARDYVGAEVTTLGRVLAGTGNGVGTENGVGTGRGSGTEGLVMGDLICTHLHGPVLARNPVLADHLLKVALARLGFTYARGARGIEVDEIAKAARNQIAVRLGLATE